MSARLQDFEEAVCKGGRPRSSLRRRRWRDPGRRSSARCSRCSTPATRPVVDQLHAYIQAGFTENIIHLRPGEDPVRAAEVAAERVLPAIIGQRR
jgi:hypothetical protein